VFGLVVRCKVSGSLCQKRGRRSRRLTGRPGPAGSEHHITCDSAAIPLAILTTAGNVPTSKPPLVEAIPPVAGRSGRPRRKPDAILADGGYDSREFREWLHARRIVSVIPQRGRKKIIWLGRIRWVVEQRRAPSPIHTPRRTLGSAPAHASGLHQTRRHAHLLGRLIQKA
jgi:hypothetical protein